MRIKSGSISLVLRIASSPEVAVVGTSYPRRVRLCWISLATMVSSSTTRIFADTMASHPFLVVRLVERDSPCRPRTALQFDGTGQFLYEQVDEFQPQRGRVVLHAVFRNANTIVAHLQQIGALVLRLQLDLDAPSLPHRIRMFQRIRQQL